MRCALTPCVLLPLGRGRASAPCARLLAVLCLACLTSLACTHAHRPGQGGRQGAQVARAQGPGLGRHVRNGECKLCCHYASCLRACQPAVSTRCGCALLPRWPRFPTTPSSRTSSPSSWVRALCCLRARLLLAHRLPLLLNRRPSVRAARPVRHGCCGRGQCGQRRGRQGVEEIELAALWWWADVAHASERIRAMVFSS